jgi:hypothetical protein
MGGAKRYPSAYRALLPTFAKRISLIRDIARPVLGINSEFYRTVKRRMRSIHDPSHQPMLDRADVDVVDMTRKVALVANGVLPVTPLLDAAFAPGSTALGNSFAGRQAAREARFDQPPAGGGIRVALRQCPDRVETIGQDDHRLDRERMVPPRLPKRGPQFVDVLRQ